MPGFTRDDTQWIVSSSTGGTSSAGTAPPAPAPQPSRGGTTVTPRSGGTTSYNPPSYTPSPSYGSGGRSNYTPPPTYYGPPAQPAYNPLSGGSANTGSNQPNRVYLPIVAPAPKPTFFSGWQTQATPSPYGPPAPSVAVPAPTTPQRAYGPPAPSTDPLRQALQKWQNSKPAQQPWTPYQVNTPQMQVGLTGPRVDTGAPDIQASRPTNPTVTSPTVAPSLPFYDRAQDGLVQDRVQPNPWTQNVRSAWTAAQPELVGPVNQNPPPDTGLVEYTPEVRATLERAVNAPGGGNVIAAARQWLTSPLPHGVQVPQDIQPINQSAWLLPEQVRQNEAYNAAFERTRQTGIPAVDYALGTIANIGKREQQQAANNQLGLGQRAWDAFVMAGEAIGLPARAMWSASIISPTSPVGKLLQGTAAGEYTALPAGAYGAALVSALKTPKTEVPSDYSSLSAAIASNVNQAKVSWANIASSVRNSLSDALEYQHYIAGLPPEKRYSAQQATTIILGSGTQAAREAANLIANKDELVADLKQRAEKVRAYALTQAAAAQNADTLGKHKEADGLTDAAAKAMLDSARIYNRATELQGMNTQQIIENKMSPGGELVAGLFADPFFGFGGLADKIGEAVKTGRQVEAFQRLANLKPGEVEQMVKASVAFEAVPKAAQSALRNFTINLFGRTAETRVHTTTNIADTLFTSILNQTQNANEAKAAVKALFNGTIARGVQLGDRTVVIPKTILAARETLDALPKLKYLEKPINALLDAAAKKPYNKLELLGKVDDLVFDGMRQFEGLGKLPQLPAGAVKWTQRTTKAGTVVIDYLDRSGTVLRSSAEMLPDEAQRFVKNLKTSAKSSATFNPIKFAASTQRAIMSDMFLNLSPRHWIKNAVNGYGVAAVDGHLMLRSISDMVGSVSTKFEGVVPGAIRGMVEEGTTPLSEEIGRNFWTFGGRWTENNPLAAISTGAGRIWTSINSPIGESRIRTMIYTSAFEKFFAPMFKQVAEDFGRTLTSQGVDPAIAKSLSHLATETGVTGSAADVATKLRAEIHGATVSTPLREVVPQTERLAPEVYNAVRDVVSQATPENKGTILSQLDGIKQQAQDLYGQLIKDAPPMPGRAKFTEVEALQDGHDIIGSAVESAKAAGVDPAPVQAEAEALVKGKLEAENNAWQAVRQEIKNNPNENVLHAGMDFFEDMHQTADRLRGEMDTLGRQAAEANTPEAWANKWAQTKTLIADHTSTVHKLADDTRSLMGRAATGEVIPRKYDMWDMLEGMYKFDEEANRAARAVHLGSPGKEVELGTWQKTIDAWRAYVDHSMNKTIATFRQYPSQSAFDIIHGAQKDIQAEGLRVRGVIEDLQKKFLPKNKTAYHKARNEAWAVASDNAAVRYYVARIEIIMDGLAQEAGKALTWTEPATEYTYKLVRPLEDDKWLVRNMDTGEHVEAYGKPLDQAKLRTAQPWNQVPDEVINNYKQLVGEANETAARIEREVAANVPPPAPRVEAPVTPAPEAVAPTTYSLNDLRKLADQAGIATISEKGKPINARMMNAINKNRRAANLSAVTYEQLRNDEALRAEVAQTLLDRIGPVQGPELPGVAFREANPTAPNPALTNDEVLRDAFGAGGKDVKDVILEANRGVEQSGVAQSPTIGSKASYDYDQLEGVINAIDRNYEALVTPKPNTMTEAQKLLATQGVDDLVNMFREIVAGADNVGKSAMSHAMLNYDERRNFDTLMSWLFGYHYFWSRSPLNWAKRLMYKPSLINTYYQEQQAVARENKQSGADKILRLKGTLPNPIAPLLPASMQEDYARIGGNPIYWLFPFNFTNDFVNPEEANNQFEGYLMSALQYLPGLLPANQVGIAAVMDYLYPLGAGEKRMDATQLQNYIPALKMYNEYKQATTGEIGSAGFFGTRDQYELGRISESLGVLVAQGKVDPIAAGYANQLLKEAQQGHSDNLIELSRHPEAQEALKLAAEKSGSNLLRRQITSFLTALPVYQDSAAERALRDAAAERPTLGYNETANPMGSKAAQTALGNEPILPGSDVKTIEALVPWWQRSDLYKAQYPAGKVTPGESTAFSEMLGEMAKTKAAKGGKLTHEEYETIKAKYPNAQQYESAAPTANMTPAQTREFYRTIGNVSPSGTSGMNPQELAQYRQDEEQRLLAGNDFQASMDNIRGRFGKSGVDAYQKYLDQPAGDAREKYSAAHPELGPLKMAAYNPRAYDDLTKQFGSKAWDAIYDPTRPKYPTNPTKENLAAYGKAIGAWYDAHPGYDQIDLWAKGRTTWWEQNSTTRLSLNYDYGRDYQEAQRIFGKDIFKIAAGIPDGDSKAAKKARAIYYKAHNPELTGYNEWRNQFKELPTSISQLPTINFAAVNDASGREIDNASFLPGAGPLATPPVSGKTMPVVGDAQAYADLYSGSGGGGGGGRRRSSKRRSSKHSSHKSSHRSSRRSSGRRGGRGGGGYGGGYSGSTFVEPVQPEGMMGGLWPSQNYVQHWKPVQTDLSWLEAGRRIGPSALKPWRPLRSNA